MAAVKDALDPSWINKPDPDGPGPSYDAEELRRLQGYQLAGGATAGSSRTGILNPRDLALSLSGSNVLVGAGGAVIGTAKGAYVAGVTASTTIGALVAADVTNPRRDRVVLEILDPDNGGTAGRKAQLRIIDGTPNASAATGAGYPAEPVLAITLGYVDVPKAGAGSPSITALPPITAAAGAPIPVRSQAEREGLPKWDGLQVQRLDLSGRPVESWDGATWSNGPGWITYTPSLLGTTTNPNIGSGQALGRYMVVGKMMFVQAFVSFGTGTSVGSGTYQVTLPPGFTYGGLGSALPIGDFSSKFNAAAEVSGVVKLASAGSSRMQMYWQSGAGNTTQSPVAHSSVAWTNGSNIAVQVAVPIA